MMESNPQPQQPAQQPEPQEPLPTEMAYQAPEKNNQNVSVTQGANPAAGAQFGDMAAGQSNPSLPSQAGALALNSFSAAGNVLDLPLSMLKETATWLPGGIPARNPFDQILDPMGFNAHENRLDTREALRHHGLVSKEDTWGNFGGALAIDIALDPLTYVGVGVATRGLKALQKMGVTDIKGIAQNISKRTAGKNSKTAHIGHSSGRSLTAEQILKEGEDQAVDIVNEAGKLLADPADKVTVKNRISPKDGPGGQPGKEFFDSVDDLKPTEKEISVWAVVDDGKQMKAYASKRGETGWTEVEEVNQEILSLLDEAPIQKTPRQLKREYYSKYRDEWGSEATESLQRPMRSMLSFSVPKINKGQKSAWPKWTPILEKDVKPGAFDRFVQAVTGQAPKAAAATRAATVAANASPAAIVTDTAAEIPDDVWAEFVNGNNVPDDVLEDLTNRIIQNEPLTARQDAVRQNNLDTINEALGEAQDDIQETATTTPPPTEGSTTPATPERPTVQVPEQAADMGEDWVKATPEERGKMVLKSFGMSETDLDTVNYKTELKKYGLLDKNNDVVTSTLGSHSTRVMHEAAKVFGPKAVVSFKIAERYAATWADLHGATPDEYFQTLMVKYGGESDTKIANYNAKVNPDAAKETMRVVGRVITGFQKPDIASFMHEIAHDARQMFDSKMQDEMQDAVAKQLGIDVADVLDENGRWTSEAEEAFSNGFETYLVNGETAAPALQTVFAKISKFIKDVYDSMRGIPEAEEILNQNLHPALKETFDTMLDKKPPRLPPSAPGTPRGSGPAPRALGLDDLNQAPTQGAKLDDVNIDGASRGSQVDTGVQNSADEFDTFVQTGQASEETIERIARKIALDEDLTQQEFAISQGLMDEVEDAISRLDRDEIESLRNTKTNTPTTNTVVENSAAPQNPLVAQSGLSKAKAKPRSIEDQAPVEPITAELKTGIVAEAEKAFGVEGAEEVGQLYDAMVAAGANPRVLATTMKSITPEEAAGLSMRLAGEDSNGIERLAQSAFHGTPHEFQPEMLVKMPDGSQEYLGLTDDMPEGAEQIAIFPNGRFSTSKIGTGEGNQAYGWGLYFAEDEAVSRWYRRTLSRQGPSEYKGEAIPELNLYREELDQLADEIDQLENLSPRAKAVSQYLRNGAPDGNYLRNTTEGAREELGEITKKIEDLMLAQKASRETNGAARVAKHMRLHGVSADEAKDLLLNKVYAWDPDEYRQAIEEVKLVDTDQFNKQGSLLKVDLKPKNDEYLLWDKPLDDQPGAIKKKALQALQEQDAKQAEYLKNAKKKVEEKLSKTQPDADELLKTEEGRAELSAKIKTEKEHDLLLQYEEILFDQNIPDSGAELYRRLSKGVPVTPGTVRRALQEIEEEIAPMAESVGQTVGSIDDHFYEYMYTGDRLSKGQLKAIAEELSIPEPAAERIAEKISEAVEALPEGLGEKRASEVLKEAGVRGIKYLDANSRRRGDGKHNFVIFDDADIEIVERLAQKQKGKTKGLVEFKKDGEAIIKAIQGSADTSTLIHETGHVLRRNLSEELSVRLDSEMEKLIKDPKRLKAAMGEGFDASKAKLKNKNGSWTREAEEVFAKAWEQYILEGKAPTAALTRVFAKLKEMMSRVYKTLVDTKAISGGDIPEGIRKVMDDALGKSPELSPLAKRADEWGLRLRAKPKTRSYSDSLERSAEEPINLADDTAEEASQAGRDIADTAVATETKLPTETVAPEPKPAAPQITVGRQGRPLITVGRTTEPKPAPATPANPLIAKRAANQKASQGPSPLARFRAGEKQTLPKAEKGAIGLGGDVATETKTPEQLLEQELLSRGVKPQITEVTKIFGMGRNNQPLFGIGNLPKEKADKFKSDIADLSNQVAEGAIKGKQQVAEVVRDIANGAADRDLTAAEVKTVFNWLNDTNEQFGDLLRKADAETDVTGVAKASKLKKLAALEKASRPGKEAARDIKKDLDNAIEESDQSIQSIANADIPDRDELIVRHGKKDYEGRDAQIKYTDEDLLLMFRKMHALRELGRDGEAELVREHLVAFFAPVARRVAREAARDGSSVAVNMDAIETALASKIERHNYTSKMKKVKKAIESERKAAAQALASGEPIPQNNWVRSSPLLDNASLKNILKDQSKTNRTAMNQSGGQWASSMLTKDIEEAISKYTGAADAYRARFEAEEIAAREGIKFKATEWKKEYAAEQGITPKAVDNRINRAKDAIKAVSNAKEEAITGYVLGDMTDKIARDLNPDVVDAYRAIYEAKDAADDRVAAARKVLDSEDATDEARRIAQEQVDNKFRITEEYDRYAAKLEEKRLASGGDPKKGVITGTTIKGRLEKAREAIKKENQGITGISDTAEPPDTEMAASTFDAKRDVIDYDIIESAFTDEEDKTILGLIRLSGDIEGLDIAEEMKEVYPDLTDGQLSERISKIQAAIEDSIETGAYANIDQPKARSKPAKELAKAQNNLAKGFWTETQGGELGEQMAILLNSGEHFMRANPASRMLFKLFEPEVMNSPDFDAQEIARIQHRAMERATFRYRKTIAPAVAIIGRSQFFNQAAIAKQLKKQGSALTGDDLRDKVIDVINDRNEDVINFFESKEGAKLNRELFNVDETDKSIENLEIALRSIKNLFGPRLRAERRAGLKGAELIDKYASYFPRTRANPDGSFRRASMTGGPMMDASQDSQIMRDLAFRDLPGKRPVIDDLSRDKEFFDIYEKQLMRGKGPDETIREEMVEHLSQDKYLERLLGDEYFDEAGYVTDEGYDRLEQIAKAIANLGRDYADNNMPLFGRNFLHDAARYFEQSFQKEAIGRVAQKLVAENLTKKGNKTWYASNLFKQIKMDNPQAYKNVINKMGLTAEYKAYAKKRIEKIKEEALEESEGLTAEIGKLKIKEDGSWRLTMTDSEGNATAFDRVLTNDDLEGYFGLAREFADKKEIGVDEDVYKAATRFMEPWTTPKDISTIQQAANASLNLFKSAVTLPFPSFHGRNFMSGQMQNFFYGAFDPTGRTPIGRYVKPIRQALTMRNSKPVRGLHDEMPELVREEIRDWVTSKRINVSDTSPEEMDALTTEWFREKVFEYGITGDKQGYGSEKVGEAASNVVSQFPGASTPAKRTFRNLFGLIPEDPTVRLRNRLNPIAMAGSAYPTLDKAEAGKNLIDRVNAKKFDNNEFILGAIGGQLAFATEDLNRIAPFLAFIKQGFTPEEAARKVQDIQFDYSKLTDFERRYMRSIFPFYNFSSKALKLTTYDLATNPGGPQAWTIRAINRAQDREDAIPEHIRRSTAISLGKNNEGGDRYLRGFGLAFEDPLEMLSFAHGDFKTTASSVLSKMRPGLQTPIEIATGRSLFFERPFEDMDPQAGRLLSNLAGKERKGLAEPIMGSPGAEFLLSKSPASRYLSTANNLLDDRKGFLAKSVNLLSGLKVTDVNAEAKQRILVDRMADEMKELGAREMTIQYVPEWQKERLDPEQTARLAELKSLVSDAKKRTKELAKLKEMKNAAANITPE